MTFKILSWFVLLIPAFAAIGIYTFLLPMVGELLALIGSVCAAMLLLMTFVRYLGLPIK